MEFLNQTPFEFALTPWEADPGRWRLTLIVKGTFDLTPDGVAVPAAEQRPPTGDEPYPDVDDDLPQSIRYPSDFAFAKPQADILLAGTCHAPQNTPAPMCKATIGVGTFEKSVLVFGARHWEHVFGLLPTATEPEPFSSVELRYENSYGGPGFQPNPIGRGREKIGGPHGARRPLPLMEPPEALSSAHGTANRPVGFGPLHDSWPPPVLLIRSASLRLVPSTSSPGLRMNRTNRTMSPTLSIHTDKASWQVNAQLPRTLLTTS